MAQFLIYQPGLAEEATYIFHMLNRKAAVDYKKGLIGFDESRLNKSICEKGRQCFEENIVDEIIFSDYGSGAAGFLEGNEDFDGFV